MIVAVYVRDCGERKVNVLGFRGSECFETLVVATSTAQEKLKIGIERTLRFPS